MDQRILEWIELFSPYVNDYGYLVLFVGVMAENAFLPVPGETALIIAAFYCYHGQLDLTAVMALATGGCILGGTISFYFGRRLGRPFLERYGRLVLITPERLRAVERFFERHGSKAILLQRWVAGARVIGALVAGTTHMPWSRFQLFNCLGSIAWVMAVSLSTYALAVNLPLLVRILERSGWVLLGVLAVIVLAIYLKSRIRL